MLRKPTSATRRLFSAAGMLLACKPAAAFLMPFHRRITNNALDNFPQLPEAQKLRISQGSLDADLDEGGLPYFGGPYDKRYHFDNNFSYQAVMDNYLAMARLIDENLAARDANPWEFGKLLHAVEDFYSHSNYIPLYRDFQAQNGNAMVGVVPPLEHVLLRPKDYRRFLEILKKDLRTGRYPSSAWRPVALDTDHGDPTMLGGMHKDWPGRGFHVAAREAATLAVVWFLHLYLKDPATRREWRAVKAAVSAGAR